MTAIENVYILKNGFISTRYPSVTSGSIANLLISPTRKRFGLDVNGAVGSYRAVVNTPPLRTRIVSRAAQVVRVGIHPAHPGFRRFGSMSATGIVNLDREAFAPWDEMLVRAYNGALDALQADTLFRGLVAATMRYCPEASIRDCRIDSVLDILHRDPASPLSDLAIATGLSYHRTSHLFSETVGVSLRSYLAWLKVENALRAILQSGPRCRLKVVARATGFSDSAHLSRVFRLTFGFPPSYLFREDKVKVVSTIDRACSR